MFDNFPYTNFHEMNLDWMIKIAKDFLDQYTHIQETITQGLEDLDQKAQDLEQLLQAWYDQHSQDIADQLADALNDLNDWYTEHQGYLDQTLQDNIAAFNQAADQKAAQAIASIPADYTELSNEVNAIDKLFTVGLNIYNNEGTQINKALVNGTGEERDLTGTYLSEFIEVDPNTEYYISKAIGSASTHPSLAVYDSNKNYISQIFQSATGGYTYTTPATAAFVRLVWLIDSGNIINIERTPRFDNAVVNTNTLSAYANPYCRIFSDGQISYNKNTGYITSTSNIVIVFGETVHGYGSSVYVGIGDVIYFNNKTKNLHAETNFIVSPNEYLIAILTSNELVPTITPNSCALSAFNIFNYNEQTNVFSINVQSQPAFLIFNNYYYRIPANTYIEFTMSEDVAYIYFNTQTEQFVKSTSYSELLSSRGFVVFNKYYWNYWCIDTLVSNMNNTSYKNVACFGDSLTWYDGHAFDWGAEQGNICYGYETYLKSAFNFRNVYNFGISGATTPQIMAALKSYSDISTIDYLFLMSGDNDDRLNITIGSPAPIGSTFDTTTVYGSLQDAIEYVLTVKPDIRIILMTEPQGWTYRTDRLYSVDPDIPEAIRTVASIYNLPLIDLWKESGINQLTRNTFLNDPPTNTLYMYHPNNIGWERLSRIILQEFKRMK